LRRRGLKNSPLGYGNRMNLAIWPQFGRKKKKKKRKRDGKKMLDEKASTCMH
jgi:hypothetical protein